MPIYIWSHTLARYVTVLWIFYKAVSLFHGSVKLEKLMTAYASCTRTCIRRTTFMVTICTGTTMGTTQLEWAVRANIPSAPVWFRMTWGSLILKSKNLQQWVLMLDMNAIANKHVYRVLFIGREGICKSYLPRNNTYCGHVAHKRYS